MSAATNTVGKAWIVGTAFGNGGQRFDCKEAAMAFGKTMAGSHPNRAFEVFECVAVLVHEPVVRVIDAPEESA